MCYQERLFVEAPTVTVSADAEIIVVADAEREAESSLASPAGAWRCQMP